MGFTLGFHIILASLGVAFPVYMLIADYRGLRRNDPDSMELARRWSKVAAKASDTRLRLESYAPLALPKGDPFGADHVHPIWVRPPAAGWPMIIGVEPNRHKIEVVRSISVRLSSFTLVVLTAALVASGCGADNSPLARERAEKLVDETQKAGVGQNVTVENAEALYGTSASQVCDLFKGSGDQLNFLGNAPGRRWSVITSDAVEYSRLVVEAYCPDNLARFDSVVDQLDVSQN